MEASHKTHRPHIKVGKDEEEEEDTLIPEYHDGNEHVFGPRKTHEFETEIYPDNICLGMIYPLASITNIHASINSKNGINIIHFNARSMNTNFKQIERYIPTFEI